MPLPAAPRGPRPEPRPEPETRDRSRSPRGERGEPEPEALPDEGDDSHSLVQIFRMGEWQGLLDEGVSGADLSELDNFIGDLSLVTDDSQRPLHERAQAMWSLFVLNRAIRHAIRISQEVSRLLTIREVPGGAYLPSDDATRGRLLYPCRHVGAVMANIYLQAFNNALDDAWVRPDLLPPRFTEQSTPPRSNPARTPVALVFGDGETTRERLRRGEDDTGDGRGRDHTRRSAMTRDDLRRNILGEFPASSAAPPQLPWARPTQPAAEESGEADTTGEVEESEEEDVDTNSAGEMEVPSSTTSTSFSSLGWSSMSTSPSSTTLTMGWTLTSTSASTSGSCGMSSSTLTSASTSGSRTLSTTASTGGSMTMSSSSSSSGWSLASSVEWCPLFSSVDFAELDNSSLVASSSQLGSLEP